MDPKLSRGHILLVEDDPAVSGALQDALAEKGYAATATATVAEAKRLLDAHPFDLAVVDMNLPDGSGQDVCRHVREAGRLRAIPVIALTGQSGTEALARGLEAGADYYLNKPMAASELLLWIRSLLRRVHNDWNRGTTIGVPGLRINPDIRTVWSDRQIVRGLTAKEFDLLLALAQAHPGGLTVAEIFREVWKTQPFGNTLAVHVRSLRRKLGLKGGTHILTTPDGYRLE